MEFRPAARIQRKRPDSAAGTVVAAADHPVALDADRPDLKQHGERVLTMHPELHLEYSRTILNTLKNTYHTRKYICNHSEKLHSQIRTPRLVKLLHLLVLPE